MRRNSVRYEVRVVDSARKQLDKLSADAKGRILPSLFDLEKEPRPVNSRKLKGGKKMDYTIILHPAEEGGYWAEVPALPGCFSQGETVEETLIHIKEAIESHLIALKTEGKEAPKDQTMVFSHVEI